MTIKQDIAEIKKHIATLNDEHSQIAEHVSCLKTDMAVVKNDIKWIKTWGIGILTIIQVIIGVLINKIL